jgi:hypothetical protein
MSSKKMAVVLGAAGATALAAYFSTMEPSHQAPKLIRRTTEKVHEIACKEAKPPLGYSDLSAEPSDAAREAILGD